MAVTLVLRFADVGIATYASLRVVGEPARTVTWVVTESDLVAALDQLSGALPEPRASETVRDAVERAIATGPFAAPGTEQAIARTLGAQLLAPAAWQLLIECVASPRAALFVSPSARLARVPWGLLAMSNDDGYRLMELADVLMAAPSNIIHSARTPADWDDRRDGRPLLILDPRVPGQRPTPAWARYSADPRRKHRWRNTYGADAPPGGASRRLKFGRAVPPHGRRSRVAGRQLDRQPSRLLFVGHATAADGDVGHADRAALHLADERPLTAADLMSAKLPMPPRIAMMACASGGDYQFDEATGLVGDGSLWRPIGHGHLWSLPTAAGYRSCAGGDDRIRWPSRHRGGRRSRGRAAGR